MKCRIIKERNCSTFTNQALEQIIPTDTELFLLIDMILNGAEN